MKKLLIISPYFPPVNAADMQRVRTSLPYFAEHGWNAEVVMVEEQYAEVVKDQLLLQSLPSGIKIHRVKALDKKWTGKLGLGSIAMRSLFFYWRKVDNLLSNGKYDLIYFSTTQFPVCILGSYWKKRFKVSYVIDMQDPWHSDYYKNKPKDQQPKKYWFSYRLNKYLEPIAMKNVSGLISVSENYITGLKNRYPVISAVPSAVITLGAFEADLQIARDNKNTFPVLLNKQYKCIVYVGRGGHDMHQSLTVLFKTFKNAIETDSKTFEQFRFYFIGTSYAAAGNGVATISPLAKQFGIEKYVVELTDRISYYYSLVTLEEADALFIPGSDDPAYTASKIYPYIMVRKPLLAILNKESSAIKILKEYGLDTVYGYQDVEQKDIFKFLTSVATNNLTTISYNQEAVQKYSAANMAAEQCVLFDEVIHEQN